MLNTNLHLNLTVCRSIRIAVRQHALDLDRALGCFQCAVEFNEEGVANRFDLGSVEGGERFPVATGDVPPAIPGQAFRRADSTRCSPPCP